MITVLFRSFSRYSTDSKREEDICLKFMNTLNLKAANNLIFGNASLGYDSFWSHLQGRPPTGSNFYWREKHVSPPGLEPGSLEPGSLEYRSNALTTKLRRHMVKNMLFTSVSQAMDILIYPIHLCQDVF